MNFHSHSLSQPAAAAAGAASALLGGWHPWSWMRPKARRAALSPVASASREPGRPSLGLALSSGGAKGLAHVGVIQVLEEHGIRVDAVAGTSMGAYVGAMWCAGLDGSQLEALAAEMRGRRDLLSLVDPVVWPRRGFIRGQKIERRLRDTLGDKTFAELERPLYVLATEFTSLSRAVLREGDVASAVLASIAIPGIVEPVERGAFEYLDGGVCEPLPVATLRREAAVDLVIAVNVLPSLDEFHSGRRPAPDLRSMPLWQRPLRWLNQQVNWFARGNILDTLRGAAMAAQMRVVEHSTDLADVLIRPVDREVRWHDYTGYRRYIEIGREAAERAMPEIAALLSGLAPDVTSETESKEVGP